MNPSLKIVCIAGLALSSLLWILFCLVQLLHAESLMMPASGLLITGFILCSLFPASRALGGISVLLSLFPLGFLVYGTAAGHDDASQAPIIVTMLIWLWALFYAFVAVCLASRIPSLNPAQCSKPIRAEQVGESDS